MKLIYLTLVLMMVITGCTTIKEKICAPVKDALTKMADQAVEQAEKRWDCKNHAKIREDILHNWLAEKLDKQFCQDKKRSAGYGQMAQVACKIAAPIIASWGAGVVAKRYDCDKDKVYKDFKNLEKVCGQIDNI